MRLSSNFTLEEFTRSQCAARNGVDNTPGAAVIENLERLCKDYLEPLRSYVGAPIIVSSGYRSPAVNQAVGGSKSSAHMFGLAVDIVVPGVSVREVCRRASLLRPQFDQIIDEFGAWAHLSIPNKGVKPRGHLMQARRVGGSVLYNPVSFT